MAALDVQDFNAAYESALTKFDSLPALFSRGCSPQEVCGLLVLEVRKDVSEVPKEQLEHQVGSRVGRAYSQWIRDGGVAASEKSPLRSNPLPWASIDAYPDWVVKRVLEYSSSADRAARLLQAAWRWHCSRSAAKVAPSALEKELKKLQRAHLESRRHSNITSRRALESELLRVPLLAASVKYDGTCFGRLHDGTLLGRNAVAAPGKYMMTSTEPVERCDPMAFKRALQGTVGREVGDVVIYGELLCNPGYYGYQERGLAGGWLCFGAVLSGTGPEAIDELSQALATKGFAHSVGQEGHVRLLLCGALRALLVEVARCQVVDEPYAGFSHAEMVAKAAPMLAGGEAEGVVIVMQRKDGQASVRKWKNSSEGGGCARRHAAALKDAQALAERLAGGGLLDAGVATMLGTMRAVAECETQPVKVTAKQRRQAEAPRRKQQ